MGEYIARHDDSYAGQPASRKALAILGRLPHEGMGIEPLHETVLLGACFHYLYQARLNDQRNRLYHTIEALFEKALPRALAGWFTGQTCVTAEFISQLLGDDQDDTEKKSLARSVMDGVTREIDAHNTFHASLHGWSTPYKYRGLAFIFKPVIDAISDLAPTPAPAERQLQPAAPQRALAAAHHD
ncbi:MAG TPA: hypothetical protein VHB73_03520 [Alphaproteobacteria bacterium]|nr:hypothetical protein [Alphaproteobacteria bacterium]